MTDLSDKLKRFIADSTWIFAKTYAETWPHEYIVQERVDNASFLELASHIDTHGYEAEFYTTRQTYFDHEGNTYWHMGNIINRCPETEAYRTVRTGSYSDWVLHRTVRTGSYSDWALLRRPALSVTGG